MRQIWVIAQNTIKALVKKKDFYVFLMMLLVLLVLLSSENFFGVKDASRYVKDIGYFCLWTFSLIIAIIFSAKQLPDEMDSKTIYLLLAKPVSRAYVILGRFLGSILATSLAYTIFYLLFIAITLLKGEGIAFSLIIQGLVFGICFLSVVCAVSIFLSLCFTLSTAIVLSFIIYFSVMWLANGLRVISLSTTGLKSYLLTFAYYLIPHYEFFNLRVRLVHSWEAVPLWVFSSIVLYTCVYTGIVLYLSYLRLNKRIL